MTFVHTTFVLGTNIPTPEVYSSAATHGSLLLVCNKTYLRPADKCCGDIWSCNVCLGEHSQVPLIWCEPILKFVSRNHQARFPAVISVQVTTVNTYFSCYINFLKHDILDPKKAIESQIPKCNIFVIIIQFCFDWSLYYAQLFTIWFKTKGVGSL